MAVSFGPLCSNVFATYIGYESIIYVHCGAPVWHQSLVFWHRMNTILNILCDNDSLQRY
jgi:hypothetical protein